MIEYLESLLNIEMSALRNARDVSYPLPAPKIGPLSNRHHKINLGLYRKLPKVYQPKGKRYKYRFILFPGKCFIR